MEQAAACEDVECGAHGSCTARLLGGSVHVSKHACVCEPPWSGPRCDLNPCDGPDAVSCGAHGTCSAVGDTGMQCDCDAGWSGEACDCACSGQGVNGQGFCPSAGSSDVQLCQINGGACSPSLYGTLKDNDGEVITSMGKPPVGLRAWFNLGVEFRPDLNSVNWCIFHNAASCRDVPCRGANSCQLAD